ncbi:MAG: hypothetical protein EON47_07750 [Acetobacteraceae bacterium]|nr:MAG: hypothetical protein EON47_07750 [Acetobacteraceae bacterium]
MPGPHRRSSAPSAAAEAERRNHRWQGPSLDLLDSPAWLQREARVRGFGAGAAPPIPIDTIALALAADTRHARREAWLGVLLGLGAVVLMVQGWFLPLLAAAFVAAPVVGVTLAMLDGRVGR